MIILAESDCYEILINSNFLHLRNRFLCNSGDYLLSTLLIELLDNYNNENYSMPVPRYARTIVCNIRILAHKSNCNLIDFFNTIDKLVELDLAKIEVVNVSIRYNLNFEKIFKLYIDLI